MPLLERPNNKIVAIVTIFTLRKRMRLPSRYRSVTTSQQQHKVKGKHGWTVG